MTYEIEGELEDPKTGEKLPFKATFKMISKISRTDIINESLNILKDEHNDKRDNEHQDGAAT